MYPAPFYELKIKWYVRKYKQPFLMTFIFQAVAHLKFL